MSKNIAIIMRNRLEALGLTTLLSAQFNAQASHFLSLEEVPVEQREKFKFYITTTDEFLSNLSFFMPHSDTTLIVSHTFKEKGYNIIDPMADELTTIAAISPFFQNKETSDNQTRLTQRETMVLQLVVEGLINKEIADRLNISINTVLTHRKNISAKLGIKSVSGLSVYAIMNGIVSPK